MCVRFSPKTLARALQFFTQVVNPPMIKNVRDLPVAIEAWENKRSVCLQENSGELSPKTKTAVLISM